jgi:hypothetical protein
MTHHPGIHSARHLLEKLRRELARLEAEVSSDTFANFVITAHSICDWIENDPSVPAAARSALPAMRVKEKLQVCRDLANGTKHFRLNYPDATVVDATCTTAYGMGRYGVGPHGVGEPTIQISFSDGRLTDGLTVAREVMAEWQQFFSDHGI